MIVYHDPHLCTRESQTVKAKCTSKVKFAALEQTAVVNMNLPSFARSFG